MGREIRRCPPDWKHPKDEQGRFIPLHDEDFDSALKEYLRERKKYKKKPELDDDGKPYSYEDWAGGPPNPESYRREEWTKAAATGWVMYETVSEGTPLSPVFPTAEGLIRWLSTNANFWGDGPMSEAGARAFVTAGWAPSMVISNGKMAKGAAAYEPGGPLNNSDE